MSELSRAWSRSGLGRISDQEAKKAVKDAFRVGWQEREAMAHRKAAEKDAATLRLLGAVKPIESKFAGAYHSLNFSEIREIAEAAAALRKIMEGN